jgi:glutamine amidotransferase
MSIAVIDYGSGNLRSVAKAFERVAGDIGQRENVVVSADPSAVRQANRIVLPGVGAYADCIDGLKRLPGMIEALFQTVLEKRRPFLGICVGMQLMATRGLEHGEHPGLDWIAGDVVRLQPRGTGLKIPHIGWNTIGVRTSKHAVMRALAERTVGQGDEKPHAYFVHSYVFRPTDSQHVLSTTDYGGLFPAIVGRDNLIGTQFHPEKSQRIGLALIGAFLKWRP